MVFSMNAHLIDPTSRELLDLTRRPCAASFRVCRRDHHFRPQFPRPWSGRLMARGFLGSHALGEHDGEGMVKKLAAMSGSPHDIVAPISFARTDCVPLFVEELTRAGAGKRRGMSIEVSSVLADDTRFPRHSVAALCHASFIARYEPDRDLRQGNCANRRSALPRVQP